MKVSDLMNEEERVWQGERGQSCCDGGDLDCDECIGGVVYGERVRSEVDEHKETTSLPVLVQCRQLMRERALPCRVLRRVGCG